MMQLLDFCHDDPVAAFAGSHHLPHYEAAPEAETGTKAAAAVTAAVNQITDYELSIVLQAGTHHPKNYYAFAYLREFMGLFANALAFARCQILSTTTVTTGQQQPVTLSLGFLARMVLETVHSWCLTYSHRRDISAWNFLLWLLEVVGDNDGSWGGDKGDVITLRKSIVNKTARFGAEVSWDGEGLWIFVDLAARRFGVDVDWLDLESGGGNGAHDIDGTGAAHGPAVVTATEKSSSYSNQRWKIWVRRIKEPQKRNDGPPWVNDNR